MKELSVFALYENKGASSKYRVYIYKDILEDNFNVNWFFFWDNNYVTNLMHYKSKNIIRITFKYIYSTIKRIFQLYTIATRSDVILIQKSVIPRLSYTFLEHLKNKGIRIVFDVDDAVYLNARDNSDKIATISDAVICGNKNLENHYKLFNKNVFILPTIENTNLYEKYWSDTFSNKSIVWIGSKATIENLEVITRPLNKFISRHPEVKFYIISNDECGYTKKINNCFFIEWSEDTYISRLSEGTIGIMPLLNNDFNKGKCGFKLIQYLNMKKPVIGTGLGVNNDIINGNGIIANSEKEWEDAFEALLYDSNKYYKCIEHINNHFLFNYNYNRVANELVRIIQGE